MSEESVIPQALWNSVGSRMALLLLLSATGTELFPYTPYTKDCSGRPCRPGEGNPSITHSYNPYTLPSAPADFIKGPPNDADPASPQYAPLVAAARAVAKHHLGRHGHHLVLMCAADFDFREVAENWYRAIERVGMSNALVYALDAEVYQHLSSRGVPTFDGSANLDAWNRTRVQRHLQRAEAERHMAAAALTAAGLDVLLMDASQVVIGDVTQPLHELTKMGVDMAVSRSGCNGKPPVGCGQWWNLVFLRGAGTAEQRARAVAFQTAGVRKGMIDFYLRWWNGAHCMLNGFGKEFAGCRCAPHRHTATPPHHTAPALMAHLPHPTPHPTPTHTPVGPLQCLARASQLA